MFWCTKSIKFHFRWGTKLQDQKQGTGNDCDVNSGLQALRKTDFSDVFLFSHKQRTIEYHFLANWLAHNKKMTEKSVFRKGWNGVTIIPSLLFLVSRFCTPPEVKFDAFGASNTGKENRYRKVFFAIYISTLRRFNRSKQKFCHIHFSDEWLYVAGSRNICTYSFAIGPFYYVFNISVSCDINNQFSSGIYDGFFY